MMEMYGKCLNKIFYCSKRQIAINLPEMLPLTSNTHILSFLPLSKAVLEILF